MKYVAIPIQLIVYFMNSCGAQPITSAQQNKPNAKFVWFDNAGSGRQQYVYFAFEFELEAEADKAILNLFADSRYLLKVNGTNINWGPGRFYPEEIEYDEHNIQPFLRKGKM